MKYLVLFPVLCLLNVTIAQNQINTFSIKAVIIDSLDFKAMPFVSVHKTRDKKGTLSDFNGAFILEDVQPNDSIIVSHIGYEKRVVIAEGESLNGTIYLQPETLLLDEVLVLAENSILYEMVSNTRKTHSAKEEMAKSYFELESYHNEKQLELFQGYYNGTYQGYNVVDLNMKNGRFALAPLSQRLFASTESSRALYMHNMMRPNEFFPKSPFEFNKQKLARQYALWLNAKYVDEEDRTIYVISFEPRKEKNSYFSGKVWIDSFSNCILKTQLNSTNAAIHPFRPLWSDTTMADLDTVSMEITKSYALVDDQIRLNTVHFNYNLIYKTREDSLLNISTQAVLHAYNYTELFTLPFFEFPLTSHADYRRIQMLPDNRQFWDCLDEFKIENSASKNTFINDTTTVRDDELFDGIPDTNTIVKKNFFENPYVTWTGNRIIIKGISADSANYYNQKRILPRDRYNLHVQLFVEVNNDCDSIQLITKTIFDPYESFYNFETTNESQAFLNIYFDLMEIERRKLEVELEKVKIDRDLIKQVYNTALNRAKQRSEVYFKEVQRGTNKDALVKWNNVVLQSLNINNLALFSVEME